MSDPAPPLRPPPRSPTLDRRLDGLQVLRGIAAALVVVDHAMLEAINHGHLFVELKDFAGTVGRMGVNIFFVISGFIMTYSTRDSAAMPPGERVRDFARRRVLRLVPLYWVATAVTLLVGLAMGEHPAPGKLVASLLFLPNIADTGDARMPPIVGVGWTLNYESAFYLIFGVALLLPRRRALLASVLAIAAMIVVGRIALMVVEEEPWRRILVFYSFRNMIFFAIGIVLAAGRVLLPAIRSTLPLRLAATAMACALAFYRVTGAVDGSVVWEIVSITTCTLVVALAAMTPAMPATIVGRGFLHLGNASYSVYLFHLLAMQAVAWATVETLGYGNGAAFVVVATLACIAFGSAIHLGIELPMTRRLRRHITPRPAPPALSAP